MNVAVVGIGYWGQNLVRNFAAQCSVVRCCHAGDPENRRWLSEHYPSIPVTTAFEDVLADGSVDAVAIATPVETHADLAERALSAGKHVFVEKPLAGDGRRAREVAGTAAECGRTLFVGYVFLYHPLIERLAAIVRGSTVEHLHFDWRKYGTFEGDLLSDLVCHPVSIVQHLYGSTPTSVATAGVGGFVGDRDTITADLEFEGDRTATVTIDRCSPFDAKSLAARTAGGDVYAWTDDHLHERREGEGLCRIASREVEPLRRETAAFLDCLAGEERPRPDGEFATRVDETLDRIRATI